MVVMRVIYVAGKFRGRDSWERENNVRRAEETAYEVAKLGAMPVCPHANTRFFDGTLTDQFWLDGTLELMKRCDALVMVPGWESSQGAVTEKRLAEELGIPVFPTLELLKMWLDIFIGTEH